ncbi:putative bifunctional diguanylate cyclase/phosphodiesterase [Novosphingobium tardum]|uniref:Bifunctional diguanylate cyclase/phosphodiesterase n=1 Tax=Novosphingobium tardum TaxID=1538021 RepID=A0ABV8RLY2_9SPHN
MVSKNISMGAVITPELRDWVDNRLVNAHIRIIQPMVLGTVFNLLVLTICLAPELPWWAIAVLQMACLVPAAHRLWLGRASARSRRGRNPGQMIVALQANSIVHGIAFGMFCAQALPILSPAAQLVLAVSAATQISAAAYTIRTLPRSAVFFMAPVTAGLALGLIGTGLLGAIGAAVLMAASCGLLIRMVFTAHDLFITRILRERELAATSRTVKLLLNEFEESGSDWLFELDGDGRLLGVSRRFAEAAGIPPERLNTRNFVGLFEPGAAAATITDALVRRRPLRDHVVALAGSDGTWWSISGRPTYASDRDRVAYRGVISDITSQKRAERRVNHMAHYDSLTGLPNRSLFNSVLARMLDERGAEARVALLLVDVDHFKPVNDMYGHPAGDAFLREVATRMANAVEDSGLGGEGSLVARLGGDEFAIIVGGDDACDQAVRLAEVIRTEMHRTFSVGANELDTSVSIGIALAPDHAAVAEQLQVNADIALYAAKGDGRDRWEMFAPGMDEALHERHTLARDLRGAVGGGELRLFLQPLIDVETETRTGYEALLRWEHPTRGLIGPDMFIPLAEETGLIVPIGEWVIRNAFAQAAQWSGGQSIAINLSPVQLDSPNLLPTIVNALAETGLDPALVEFEITESVLLHNSDANIQMLNRLHDLGLKIALDDFGTGYASLNYLLTFPFDKIKIDRSFISDLENREESRAIVGAVIELANKLGMCTLAEGVEEAGQLAKLREHGCRMVQGWLFGQAMPSEHYQPVPARSAASSEAIPIAAAQTSRAAVPRRRGRRMRAAG